MNTRILGKSGIEVSEVGLGCWQLGGDFGPLNRETAQDILREAHRNGINFWDTADVYGDGESERRIAEFLRGNEAPAPVIATKVGRASSLYPDGYTRERVRTNIEGSAKRLGVDCLDLVQLHCVPPEILKAGDILAWMEDFQKRGLIKAFGASVETIAEAKVAASCPQMTSLQIIFNIFRQNAISELFALAQANDVGIIVRLPLASGVLSGRMVRGQKFAASDHRHYNRNGEAFSQGETFSGIPFETAIDLVEELKPLLPQGMTMAQMAMRWILDQAAVSTVIAGASSPEQAAENAGVSDLDRLPGELHRRLSDFYTRRVEPQIRVAI
jgi:aryl-alcohol dehydrogenase-like predicted oxidoreductase